MLTELLVSINNFDCRLTWLCYMAEAYCDLFFKGCCSGVSAQVAESYNYCYSAEVFTCCTLLTLSYRISSILPIGTMFAFKHFLKEIILCFEVPSFCTCSSKHLTDFSLFFLSTVFFTYQSFAFSTTHFSDATLK